MSFDEAMFFLLGSALGVVAFGPRLALVVRLLLVVVAVLALGPIVVGWLAGWIQIQSVFGWISGVAFGSVCSIALKVIDEVLKSRLLRRE